MPIAMKKILPRSKVPTQAPRTNTIETMVVIATTPSSDLASAPHADDCYQCDDYRNNQDRQYVKANFRNQWKHE